jgi:hypothetical protein
MLMQQNSERQPEDDWPKGGDDLVHLTDNQSPGGGTSREANAVRNMAVVEDFHIHCKSI